MTLLMTCRVDYIVHVGDGCYSDTEQGGNELMMRLVARTANQQRQIVEYQTQVSSLSATLDDLNVQLNHSQQIIRQYGIVQYH